MSGAGLRARVLARVPWGEQGLPDRQAPPFWTSPLGAAPGPRRRAHLRLRALAGGGALVAACGEREHVLVRVGVDGSLRTAVPARAELLDAVPLTGGGLVLLERGLGLRRVEPDGGVAWTRPTAAERLLAGGDGRLFVTAGDGAWPVDADTGELGDDVAAGWSGGELYLAGDRFAQVSYDAERDRRLWVLRGETDEVVTGDDEAWQFLGSPVGSDAAGRAYGYAVQELGRVSRDGEVDWRLALANAVVDDAGRVTVAGMAPDGALRVVGEDGALRIEPPPEAAGDAALVARAGDGGLLVHSPATRQLLRYDGSGGYEGAEPADADVWLDHDDLQAPERDSVTPDGEVLAAIRSPGGVAVVALGPP